MYTWLNSLLTISNYYLEGALYNSHVNNYNGEKAALYSLLSHLSFHNPHAGFTIALLKLEKDT